MSRPATVFGLLAIAVAIVAAIVSLSGRLDAPPAAALPGTEDGASSPFVACTSCDAHHQRLKKSRSGND